MLPEDKLIAKIRASSEARRRKSTLVMTVVGIIIMSLVLIWSFKQLEFHQTRLEASARVISDSVQSDEIKVVVQFIPGILESIQGFRAVIFTEFFVILCFLIYLYQSITGLDYGTLFLKVWDKIREIEDRLK